MEIVSFMYQKNDSERIWSIAIRKNVIVVFIGENQGLEHIFLSKICKNFD